MRIPPAVLLLFSLTFASVARCQSPELIIQGQTGKIYLEHTVVAKENWYSIGRLYNLSPKVLAPYNHRTLSQPLAIGQVLRIPLTAQNFSQTGIKTPAETLVPVYHIVREKEWMYRISVNYNKVPIPDIEKWNHINGDQLHAGLHVIVGFLKVKTALSALARSAPAGPVAGVEKTDGRYAAHSSTPPATDAAATYTIPDGQTNSGTPAARHEPPVNRQEPATTRQEPATTRQEPATTRQEPATTRQEPTTGRPSTASAIPNAPHFDGGVFRSDFSDEGNSVSGQAGVFKSTSGWQDGKYYALMNNVTVGTIVRVTDPATGKSVYAKVLGQLPDMKESAGLTIRISNAAAAELGQGEAKFMVQVVY
ncbi:MAG TPA: LysM peptidoglycan-binding domain-containing protein [Puia sp.]|nr:LysM peptidoglycan-binding domain-containing protein [Puia sp.]